MSDHDNLPAESSTEWLSPSEENLPAEPAGPSTRQPSGRAGNPLKAAVAPIAGFGVTFRTMFKKTVTEEYPEVKVPTAPRYHGRHVLNRHPDGLEKCVGCELCAWACPADAIYVEGADNTDERRFSPGERYGAVYQINYLRCIFCGLCIEACPTRALTMSNEYELADDSRNDLIFTKDQLLAPLLPGMEAPPHPMRLGDDEKAYYVGQPITPVAGDPTQEGRIRPHAARGADLGDTTDNTASSGGTDPSAGGGNY